MKKTPLCLTALATTSLMFSCNGTKTNPPEKQKLNVLFLAVDDLRPELKCYGVKSVISPNIDKLAAEGIQFNRAYCNIAVCGASRASILTGTRPRRNSFMYYYDTISALRPNIPILGKYFKQFGYYTIHNSKVMHHPHDAPGSWNEEWWAKPNGNWRDYLDPENSKMEDEQHQAPAYECVDVEDNEYKDGKTAEKTIADLKKMKKEGKAFFMAVGFYKPHLPFNAPKKYWDMYKYEDVKLPYNNFRPKNAPDVAMNNFGELRHYSGIPQEGPLSDSLARKLIQGYHACISYSDAQIGKVLNALDELGLSKNTIVVLWGDHGWNLREHGLWCKHCDFNTALNAPLIFKVPGIKGGRKTNEITEYVDVYPTLCELTGLPIPAHAEGNSFANVLKSPSEHTDGIAICRWREGYTIIKGKYFYTEWIDSSDKTYATMLYDHSDDPDENANISLEEKNKDLIKELSSELRANWGENFDK